MERQSSEAEKIDDLPFLESEASRDFSADQASGFEVLDPGGEGGHAVLVRFEELDEAQVRDCHGKSGSIYDRYDRRGGINSHQNQLACDLDAEVVAHQCGFFPEEIGRGQGIVLLFDFEWPS